jgi:hypothetical protein
MDLFFCECSANGFMMRDYKLGEEYPDLLVPLLVGSRSTTPSLNYTDSSLIIVCSCRSNRFGLLLKKTNAVIHKCLLKATISNDDRNLQATRISILTFLQPLQLPVPTKCLALHLSLSAQPTSSKLATVSVLDEEGKGTRKTVPGA